MTLSSQLQLLDWAKKLQALSQSGKTYGKDAYDLERYEQIEQISHEIFAHMAEIPELRVKELFLPEEGYATPKVDLRAGVFKDNKILLVKEKADGRWALPGGWAYVCESPTEGVLREVWEESGYQVAHPRLVAIIDRSKHEYRPLYAQHLYKLFFLCELTGGEALPNLEISEIAFFPLDELPPLSLARVLPEDIERLYRFHKGELTQAHVD